VSERYTQFPTGRACFYKSGYKYQLSRPYQIQTDITGRSLSLDFVRIFTTGELKIAPGYAWDGPSGPTFDTDSFMRGSLVHDALYQIARELADADRPSFRAAADELLYDLCRADGMWKPRALWVFWAVRRFGRAANKGRPEVRSPKS
jgi:hypothetical protein